MLTQEAGPVGMDQFGGELTLTALIRKWRFLPHPVAALYQTTFLIRRALFKTIAPIARDIRGDVLDFGCGSKPYRVLFTGCDSYVGVDIAVSGHDHVDSNIDFYYDGKHLPFGDEKFDAIVSFEVFEHVFNIDEVLKEIFRVLRPNGQIVISLPFAWPEHETPYDFGRYSSFGISSVLEQNGFIVLSTSKTNGYVEALHQLWIEYFSTRIFRPLGLFGRVAKIPFVATTNLSALVLRSILPRDDSYFSNLVIHAKRAS